MSLVMLVKSVLSQKSHLCLFTLISINFMCLFILICVFFLFCSVYSLLSSGLLFNFIPHLSSLHTCFIFGAQYRHSEQRVNFSPECIISCSGFLGILPLCLARFLSGCPGGKGVGLVPTGRVCQAANIWESSVSHCL